MKEKLRVIRFHLTFISIVELFYVELVKAWSKLLINLWGVKFVFKNLVIYSHWMTIEVERTLEKLNPHNLDSFILSST